MVQTKINEFSAGDLFSEETSVEYQSDASDKVSSECRKCSRDIRTPDDSQVDDIVYENDPHKIWTQVPTEGERRLSDKVDLCYENEYGWYWRAKRDISAGEPLLVEDFFALKLSPKNEYLYCSYCTIWCLAPMPCDGCVTEMFCSERCRQEAFTLYHETECKLLPLLGNLQEREFTLLALRIFLTGTNQGSDLLRTQPAGQDPVYELNSEGEVYSGMWTREERDQQTFKNDYRTVLTLQWLKPGVSSTEILGLMSPFVLNDMIEVFVALRRIDFFNAVPADDVYSTSFSNTEKLTMILLSQNTALLECNHSNLSATFFAGKSDFSDTKIIGVGLPTCHSFLNHSCDPRAAIIRDRRRELVYAVRNIEKDQQITISYGGIEYYGSEPYEYMERRGALRKGYRVICGCRACGNEDIEKGNRLGWKQEPEIVHNIFRPALHTNEIKEKVLEFHESLDRFVESPNNITDNNLETLFEFQTGEFRRPLMERRSQTVWMCEYLIKKWMQILRGDFRKLKRMFHYQP